MVFGVIYTLIAGHFGLNDFTKNWLQPFGDIFVNALKFIAIPLVLFSIITGVSSLGNLNQLGRMGIRTLGLYLITTVTAISVGLLLVNVVRPGDQTDPDRALRERLNYEIWAQENNIPILDGINSLTAKNDSLISILREEQNLQRSEANYVEYEKKNAAAQEVQEQPALQPLVDMVPDNLVNALLDPSRMLQVITFALFFGICISMLPREKTSVVLSFFDGMNEIFVKMVNVIMAAAPFFVFCLMAGVLAEMAPTPKDMLDLFWSLGSYMLTVTFGLLFLLFVFYPLFARLFGVRVSYRNFFNGLSSAQFLAFSTSSSAATLPVTIECVEEKLGVPRRVTDFVLPIGATVNMDGTSLYQAIAVIFLAQFHGIELTLDQQLGIIGTTTLASIGAAAIPSAGLIMLMIVLTSVGLNPLWVTIILPVDRILDMTRTVVNVTSDATVSMIIARSEEGKS